MKGPCQIRRERERHVTLGSRPREKQARPLQCGHWGGYGRKYTWLAGFRHVCKLAEAVSRVETCRDL